MVSAPPPADAQPMRARAIATNAYTAPGGKSARLRTVSDTSRRLSLKATGAGEIAVLEMLEGTSLAAWVRESPSIFSYTMILTIHAIGLAIVVGTNTLIALRLLGFAKVFPLGVLPRLYSVIWFGFWINAISGSLLFIAEATKMAAMPAFWGKLGFVAIGMTIGQVLQARYFRDAVSVNAGVVTPAARKLAWASMVCWYLALIVGRLTGYPDLVTSWFGI
jgi:hypothetical protein